MVKLALLYPCKYQLIHYTYYYNTLLELNQYFHLTGKSSARRKTSNTVWIILFETYLEKTYWQTDASKQCPWSKKRQHFFRSHNQISYEISYREKRGRNDIIETVYIWTFKNLKMLNKIVLDFEFFQKIQNSRIALACLTDCTVFFLQTVTRGVCGQARIACTQTLCVLINSRVCRELH